MDLYIYNQGDCCTRSIEVFLMHLKHWQGNIGIYLSQNKRNTYLIKEKGCFIELPWHSLLARVTPKQKDITRISINILCFEFIPVIVLGKCILDANSFRLVFEPIFSTTEYILILDLEGILFFVSCKEEKEIDEILLDGLLYASLLPLVLFIDTLALLWPNSFEIVLAITLNYQTYRSVKRHQRTMYRLPNSVDQGASHKRNSTNIEQLSYTLKTKFKIDTNYDVCCCLHKVDKVPLLCLTLLSHE